MSSPTDSGPTMSTGDIKLTLDKQQRESNSNQGPDTSRPIKACHIAVMADFSGRHHQHGEEQTALAQRKLFVVDRDNLDEVFAGMSVVHASPLAEDVIEFNELDDLHPDFIYERVGVFARLKSLRQRLQSEQTFAEAAAEVQSWSKDKRSDQVVQAPSQAESTTELNVSKKTSLLEQLLAAPPRQKPGAELDVKQLVRDIMAPHLVAAPDPRQPALLEAVDNAASELMRQLLHCSGYQQLEASWRSLYLLTKRLETDSQLKIYIVDVSQQELIDDVNSGGLKKLLVESRQSTGQEPFALLLADFCFSDKPGHVDALAYLAGLGAQSGAAVITGGHERIAGCRQLAATPDTDDWDFRPCADFSESWNSFRQHPDSLFLAVVAPRFLLRLPYGKKYSRIEQFAFEELPTSAPHDFNLWGNSAWLVALLIAQSFTQYRWEAKPGKIQQVDRLPIHVFTDDDGDNQVTPCAEVNTTDRTATQLKKEGMLVVRSIFEKDAVLIADFNAVHVSGEALKGPWS